MSSSSLAWQLFVKWDGTSYTDESARLISAQGSYRLTAPGVESVAGRGMISDCTIVLSNYDNRYSSANSSGTLYSDLSGGGMWQRDMYLNVSTDGGSNYYKVFTGVVKNMSEQSVSVGSINVVTLTCRSSEDKYLNHRISTSRADFAAWVDAPPSEADVISAFLTSAGISVDTDYIDSGLITVPFAWLDDESPIEECWLLAAASGGRFYYDVINDKFVYENASHWALPANRTTSSSGPDNTLTRSDYQGISIRWDDGNLFKSVTVEYSGRQVDASQVVWQPDEDIVIPANTAKTFEAVFRQPLYSIDSVTFHATTAGGADITADVNETLSSVSAQRCSLEFDNTNATYAAYLHGVTITGQPVTGGPEGEVTQMSADAFWTGRTARKRAIRANVYVQDARAAEFLSTMLLDVHEAPWLLYSISGLTGDPRRNLGQRISITDSDILGAATKYGFILSIDWTLDVNGYVQNVEAVDSQSTFEYIDAEDVNVYFVIGTNKMGAAPGDLRARVFY